MEAACFTYWCAEGLDVTSLPGLAPSLLVDLGIRGDTNERHNSYVILVLKVFMYSMGTERLLDKNECHTLYLSYRAYKSHTLSM